MSNESHLTGGGEGEDVAEGGKAAPKSEPEKTRPSAPEMNLPVAPQVRVAVFVAGLIMVAILLGMVVALFHVSHGFFSPGYWVGFYVSVALVTGIAFWTLTGSTGEYTNAKLGIRLGGGAAIGASFMVLAHWLTPNNPLPSFRIVPTSVPANDLSYYDHDEHVKEATRLGQSKRFLVEFNEGENEGAFSVSYIATDGIHIRTFSVPRVGTVTNNDRLEDKPK